MDPRHLAKIDVINASVARWKSAHDKLVATEKQLARAIEMYSKNEGPFPAGLQDTVLDLRASADRLFAAASGALSSVTVVKPKTGNDTGFGGLH